MKLLNQIVKTAKLDPLGEAFIITALHSYCLQVMNDHSDWGNSMISKDAWQILAKHNLTMLGFDEQGNSLKKAEQ
jgi:hypothetical protein